MRLQVNNRSPPSAAGSRIDGARVERITCIHTTMSYYPSQAYGAYSPAQQPYSAYPSSTQYNAQYQSPTQAFSSTAMKSATSEQPSAPVVSEVTPTVASQALQKVVSSELRLAGFSSVQPLALQRLELEFVACPSCLALHIAVVSES